MTLLSKATRLFLAACLIALAVSGLGGYVFLQKIMDEEATEQLAHEHQQVVNYVEQTGVLPERWFSISDSLWAVPMRTIVPTQLFDTTLTNRAEKESLMYRQLSFGIDTQVGYYQVNIRKALYKVHDLTKALLLAFGVLILLLVGILFWVNYSLSRNLWKPFYQTLAKLKTFKISEDEALHFASTEIVEFKTLQKTLEQLTQKVRQDYISLKTFTENASHELQTPLAVIGANLEQLLQATNLTQTQVEQIDSLLDVVRRISKMNQALLLLTKIENRQYDTHERIDFSDLVEDKLNLWEALIQHKGIELTTHIAPHVHIPINPFLADVLLNNLLNNAIKHNFKTGKIEVELTPQTFIVRNTGTPPSLPIEQLWERFSKDSIRNDSVGLGLALVKQICETNQLGYSYTFKDGWHTLKIVFNIS